MWPFSTTPTEAERLAGIEATRHASAAELAQQAVAAQRVYEDKLDAARAAAAETRRASAEQLEREAADKVEALRAEFAEMTKTLTMDHAIADIASEVAEIVALERKVRAVVLRIQAKVSAFADRARRAEWLAREIGETWYAPHLNEVNARAVISDAIGKANPGNTTVHEWLALGRRW